jgi:hypothetical protein
MRSRVVGHQSIDGSTDLPRVWTQLDPPGHRRGKGDAAKEVPRQLVVAGSDPAEIFEAPEHAFDEVSRGLAVETVRLGGLGEP